MALLSSKAYQEAAWSTWGSAWWHAGDLQKGSHAQHLHYKRILWCTQQCPPAIVPSCYEPPPVVALRGHLSDAFYVEGVIAVGHTG